MLSISVFFYLSNGLMKILNGLFILALCALSSVFGQAHRGLIPDESEKALPSELSDHEADAMILAEAKAGEKREAERRERRESFTMLDRKEVDRSDRKIIMRRIAPPVRRVRSPEKGRAEAGQPQPSKAELEEMLQKHREKEYRILMLSATVYNREFTELRWSHDGERFLAYSSIDFNFMRGVTEFESGGTVYSFLLGIGNESTEDIGELNRLARKSGREGLIERQIPQKPAFTPGRAEYAVLAEDPAIIERDDVFDPIDALHAYFEKNERRLRIEYQRMKALNDARKRYEAANPPEPQDIVINFWRKGER